MSHLPFHQEQLNFMIDLANSRPEFLNPLFRFLNYFDSAYFFFALIPVVWLGISYKWGLRIFYWYTLSYLINWSAKILVGWPRPSTDCPAVGLFHPQSNGFPSGGAQTCFLLGAILIYYWKTRAAWIIGLSYILLISFSRLYLGVHYPIDVLGGWALALALFLIFVKTKEPLETYLAKKGLNFCLMLNLAIPLALMVAIPIARIYYIMGSVMGIGIGTYVSLKYNLFLTPTKSLPQGIARSMIGALILFLFIYLWPFDHTFLQSFTVALIVSLGASPIYKWIMKQAQ